MTTPASFTPAGDLIGEVATGVLRYLATMFEEAREAAAETEVDAGPPPQFWAGCGFALSAAVQALYDPRAQPLPAAEFEQHLRDRAANLDFYLLRSETATAGPMPGMRRELWTLALLGEALAAHVKAHETASVVQMGMRYGYLLGAACMSAGVGEAHGLAVEAVMDLLDGGEQELAVLVTALPADVHST